MKWTLKQHGDSLEVEAADFVHSHIPYYENIWAKFIGHQGNGQMPRVTGISTEIGRLRDDFAQNHYTVLESFYFMHKIALAEKEPRTINDFEEYRRLIDALTAYFAYCGKVIDCLYKCFAIMGFPKNKPDPVNSTLKPFYEARHSFLHEKKTPLRFNESGHYKMPVMANIDKQNAWEGKLTWIESGNIEFNYIGEALYKMCEDMSTQVAALLANLYKWVDEFCEKNKIVLSEPPESTNQQQLSFHNTISGSTLSVPPTINVSGVTR